MNGYGHIDYAIDDPQNDGASFNSVLFTSVNATDGSNDDKDRGK